MKGIHDAGSNVKVVCRFRPLIDIELDLGHEMKEIYSFPTDESVIAIQGDSFTFDKVFSTTAEQSEIFDFVGRPIVDDVLTGYNGTVIAYGQTGAGKSFTMMGLDIYDEVTKGLIPRAIRLIFESVDKAGNEAEFTLKCSMLEIYKEKLKDLCGFGSELKIKESKARGIYVEGLTEIYVASEEEMLGVLAMGERNRTVASTKMNNVSSRSHQLFILEVKQKLPNDSEKRGILNLVDLAGSEKINQTGVTGNKLEEAKKINLSLSALGNVIKSLTSSAEHIPYRDSKLTRLLQESLGGNYKTTLIVNCSPHPRNQEDTLNTLKFAQRAKTIKNKVRVNIKKSAEAYIKIIDDLKNQLRKAYEETEFWKAKAGENISNSRRRASSLKMNIDLKGLKIPEVDAEDDSNPSGSQSPISSEPINDDEFKEKNSELITENEELKQKIKEVTDLMNKEILKRMESEKKYFECYENYSKLVLTISDNTNAQEYLHDENASLYREIEILKNQIKVLNEKFSKIFEKLRNGEVLNGWEFSENTEVIAGITVHSNEMPLPPSFDGKSDSLVEISVDPDTLLSQDSYAQEICLALEESSLINQDIIIFELKKQIINSGMVNCELFRILSDLRVQHSLLREKYNLKLKFSKFQQAKIRLFEKMLSNLETTFDKLVHLVQKAVVPDLIKYNSADSSKKAKIARPIKGAGIENGDRNFRRMITFSAGNADTKSFSRHKTTVHESNDFKYRLVESSLQIQNLYNQQLKSELDLIRNERDSYRNLYSNTQSQYLEVYTKEKERWRKYLDQFKENCNHELIRKQIEINRLNVQIAHWMDMYLEIQQSKGLKNLKVGHRKKNLSNIDILAGDHSFKMQLLNSPLHRDPKQNRLSQLNRKKGDVSPPNFED